MKYNHKAIISGNVIEIYDYENTIKTGKDAEREHNNGRRGNSIVESWEWETEKKQKNRADSLTKAKQTLRRTINANVHAWGEKPKFLTLTYENNFQDVAESNKNFKKFIMRLNYHLEIKLKYSAVVEFQKRGAVHYHVVLYNLPYVEADHLADIWGHGFIKVNEIDEVDNVGAYVTKYMTKENDDPRLAGRKCHFSSRGLKKADTIILSDQQKKDLAGSLSTHEVYHADFQNEFCGAISYTQYNTKRIKE